MPEQLPEQFTTAPQDRTTQRSAIIMAASVLVCVLLASIAATQYLASAFGYHPALSGQITGNLYWPWSWAVWSFAWGSLHADLIKAGAAVFTSCLAVLFLFLVAYTLRQRRLSAIEGLHGTQENPP